MFIMSNRCVATIIAVAVAFILSSSFAGCKGGIKAAGEGDEPSIDARVVGQDGEATEVSNPPLYVDGAVQMNLSAPADVDSFKDAVTLRDLSGQVMQGEVAWNPSKTIMIFKPAGPLKKGSSYVLEISPKARLANGADIITEGMAPGVAGDIDGDGVRDFVVSAPTLKQQVGEAVRESGAVYVYSGASPDGPPISQIFGNGNKDGFGSAVAIVGDVDKDGKSDLLIGAPYFGLDSVIGGVQVSDKPMEDVGVVYFFSGRHISGQMSADNADAVITGTMKQDYSFGFSVAPAGDINNDGYADVVIGEPGFITMYPSQTVFPGAIHIFSGKSIKLNKNLSASDAIAQVTGEHNGDCFGFSAADAGDVDGDGIHDILVGAPIVVKEYDYVNSNGQTVKGPFQDGKSYLFSGAVLKSKGMTTQSALAAIPGFMGSRFGWSVAGAGDVDGNGTVDVIIGAPLQKRAGTPAGLFTGDGAAYIFSGKELSKSTALNDYKWKREGALFGQQSGQEHFGQFVAGAGDVNGDGRADVMVGAPGGGGGFPLGAGKVYLFGYVQNSVVVIKDEYPPSSVTKLVFAEQLIAEITGAKTGSSANEPGDMLGSSGDGIGDLDGDGKAEILVTALSAYDFSGAAYLYRGAELAGNMIATSQPALHGTEQGDLFGFRCSGSH